jgi:hypothetical protein
VGLGFLGQGIPLNYSEAYGVNRSAVRRPTIMPVSRCSSVTYFSEKSRICSKLSDQSNRTHRPRSKNRSAF